MRITRTGAALALMAALAGCAGETGDRVPEVDGRRDSLESSPMKTPEIDAPGARVPSLDRNVRRDTTRRP